MATGCRRADAGIKDGVPVLIALAALLVLGGGVVLATTLDGDQAPPAAVSPAEPSPTGSPAAAPGSPSATPTTSATPLPTATAGSPTPAAGTAGRAAPGAPAEPGPLPRAG